LQLILPTSDEKKRKKKKKKGQQKTPEVPMFMAEPMRASNSFVGTEEYIAPVCISSHIICMIPILMFG
jgi:non-specific serine/threonine protein kinase